MASPTRTSPPPPAVEPIAPSSPPPSEHPPVKPSSDGSLSPENPAPAPPPPPPPPPPAAATPPPHTPGDSSPSSTPHPSAPQPPPPPPPPLPPSADASPHLPRQGQTSPPPPSPAPASPPTPAPASSDAKSEQESAESASESGSMTLAVVLAQTEDATPRKSSSAEAFPIGSPQKESAVTIAKLLSGEDPQATEAKATPDKVTPRGDTGSVAAAAAAVTPVGPTPVGGVGGSVGSKRWLLGGVPEKVRRAELRRAELGFRVLAAVFCLVALSVMAADTTTGWSGDSFRRYNEYRYVLAASVVAFTYCGFQLVAEVHYVVTGRHIIRAPFRSYFNLAMDQMLAYLLLSASSAALSRNDVWMSRFGGDQFTKLINASASMAFLAFIALGLNSVISAYCVFSLVS